MRNIFAFIMGWFLFIFAVVGQKQFADSATVSVPVSFAFVQEHPKAEATSSDHSNQNKKQITNSKSSGGYKQNKGIIIGAIIGVVVLVALLK